MQAASTCSMALQERFREIGVVLRSQNAISGSIIQNSARWRGVFEFSARKVGPNVYTLVNASAKISASSCPLTVRYVGLPKKSCVKSTGLREIAAW